MSRGKDFTTTELEEIRSFIKDGLSYAEVGELMGRSEKSIRNVAFRQHFNKKELKKSPSDPVFVWDSSKDKFETDTAVSALIEKPAEIKAEPVQKPEKTLKDFPFREIIKYLYDCGYRIRGKDWKVTCITEQIVKINDIING